MPHIKISLADEELEQLAQGGPEFGPRLSRLLDDEVRAFEAELQDELNGGMIPLEKAILKTYLYKRITNRRLDGLDAKPIDVVSDILAPTQNNP